MTISNILGLAINLRSMSTYPLTEFSEKTHDVVPKSYNATDLKLKKT